MLKTACHIQEEAGSALMISGLRISMMALSLAAFAGSSHEVLARCAQPAAMAYKQGVVTQKFVDIGQKTNEDPVDLFTCAAEKETDPKLKAKYYNTLANRLEKRGQMQSAYAAYEKAALAGHASAGNKVLKAHRNGLYRPRALAQIARSVYLPRARGKNGTGAARLLAKLLDSGQIKGADFRASASWPQRKGGEKSKTAVKRSSIKRMAEEKSRRGQIREAAALFRLVDKRPPNLRALREAKSFWLGKGRRKNTRLGIAWLSYASGLSPKKSARLAKRFYRSTNGAVYVKELTRIAAAGGITNLQIGSGGSKALLAAYMRAKSDAEKLKVLASLILQSKSGNGTADFALARILEADGGFSMYRPADYYVSALDKGNLNALANITSLVAVLDPVDPRAQHILGIFARLATAGNRDVQKTLGLLYIVGGPVAVDPAKGMEWLRLASDKGDVEAKYRLGVLLVQNKPDSADFEAGKTYLQSAAAAGNLAAKAYFLQLESKTP
jgi:TPR repeat protein